ncbi:hypothetical protein KC19_2G127900 [Ceratodon purpureus]|uniref:CID domain-containing protein n=1 Tax=Ceratodon purpureus TaxID=3225 RepID=A0A8T0IUY3_CERPU|nr:hypothetical protein KC19_2G127900 [Ceratodon purpureus]
MCCRLVHHSAENANMAMEGVVSNGAFTGATLAEKLTKLNVSQQSIETLSHWCIFHRKKAREIVETWAKKFHETPRDQRVPFLYLANDILQNSRRKGPEFVNEFWTVLPRVLREVVDSGAESVKNAAYRLVDIWEERRVFGSRAQGLREELLGKKPPPHGHEAKHFVAPPYQMFEGSMLERVARSYQAVQEKSADEYGALLKYSAAVSQIESLEKEAEGCAGNESLQASIADELLGQQAVIRRCIEQLEACEISHALLCSHLKSVLLEQESKLEQVRTHLQISQAQLEQAGSIHHRLISRNASPGEKAAPYNGSIRGEGDHSSESQVPSNKDNGQVALPNAPTSQINIPVTTESAENNSKETSAAKVAAEVAAKLTASSSSAAMLTSVLSSLAAEEANGAVQSPSFTADVGRPLEKRPRLEGSGPEAVSPPDPTSYLPPPNMPQYLGSSATPLPYAYQSILPPPPPPLPGRVILNQHSMGLPPQPIPPGCAPAAYQPFPPSSMPYYSQPPLPAPPAPR